MPFLSTVSRVGAASCHQIRGCLGQKILPTYFADLQRTPALCRARTGLRIQSPDADVGSPLCRGAIMGHGHRQQWPERDGFSGNTGEGLEGW